jgi:hypothetical protein
MRTNHSNLALSPNNTTEKNQTGKSGIPTGLIGITGLINQTGFNDITCGPKDHRPGGSRDPYCTGAALFNMAASRGWKVRRVVFNLVSEGQNIEPGQGLGCRGEATFYFVKPTGLYPWALFGSQLNFIDIPIQSAITSQ